jgi:hypothetical protein
VNPHRAPKKMQIAFRRAALIAVVLVAFSLPATAQQGIFTLVVNEVKKGDVIAILRRNDVLLPLDDLQAAGLKHFEGKRESLRGKPYVSVASLAPGITYEIDSKAVAIKLTADPKYLEAETVDLGRSVAPAGIIYSSNPSLLFNYAVTDSQFNQVSVTGEFALSIFGNALFDNLIERDSNGVYHRESSTLYIDDTDDSRRLTLGDVVINSNDPIGGGAQIGRVFDTNIYVSAFAIPGGRAEEAYLHALRGRFELFTASRRS